MAKKKEVSTGVKTDVGSIVTLILVVVCIYYGGSALIGFYDRNLSNRADLDRVVFTYESLKRVRSQFTAKEFESAARVMTEATEDEHITRAEHRNLMAELEALEKILRERDRAERRERVIDDLRRLGQKPDSSIGK